MRMTQSLLSPQGRSTTNGSRQPVSSMSAGGRSMKGTGTFFQEVRSSSAAAGEGTLRVGGARGGEVLVRRRGAAFRARWVWGALLQRAASSQQQVDGGVKGRRAEPEGGWRGLSAPGELAVQCSSAAAGLLCCCASVLLCSCARGSVMKEVSG
jgi:hypothetical protein